MYELKFETGFGSHILAFVIGILHRSQRDHGALELIKDEGEDKRIFWWHINTLYGALVSGLP